MINDILCGKIKETPKSTPLFGRITSFRNIRDRTACRQDRDRNKDAVQYGIQTRKQRVRRIPGRKADGRAGDCGNECQAVSTQLTQGLKKSCGCCRHPRKDVQPEPAETETERSNASGYTGVYGEKRTGKWIAQISFRSKMYYLGAHADKEEAIRVRRAGEEMQDGFPEWYEKYRGGRWEPAE